jgi:hypothetical protein
LLFADSAHAEVDAVTRSLAVLDADPTHVGVGDVTSLLAVLNGDWTHVNIHIMVVMWFV